MKNEITGMKLRLIVMNFLQFAVWGAYLTSMGTYLFNIGLGAKIGLFYAMQGIVSLFMPAGKALFFKMNLHEKSNCFISLQVI